MNYLHTTLLFLHILLGAICLMLFWVPVASAKGSMLHNTAGKLYYKMMLFIAGSGVLMCLMVAWVMRRDLGLPLRQIAQNAGVDGSVVAGKVRESNDKSFGFNAQTEEYGDMFKFGVIDPAKVTRTALEDAASVASLLITTEVVIADKPEPEPAPKPYS